MCILLGTNLTHKALETIGRCSLEELGSCLDDKLTLSDKELHAVAYGNDKETDEHDFKQTKFFLSREYKKRYAL